MHGARRHSSCPDTDVLLLRPVMILCMLFVPLPVAAQTITRLARATDSDTREIRGTHCRQRGVDAAESHQLSTQALGGRSRSGKRGP
jgi:hypothetical protein